MITDKLLQILPEKVRTRAADLAKTGAEFLEASWTAAAMGASAPIAGSTPGTPGRTGWV